MDRHVRIASVTGFSLAETMVALMVIVLGLTALRHSFPTHLAMERQAIERMQATLLGKGQLENLRLQGFTALTSTHFTTTPEPFVDSRQQVIAAPFRWHAEVQQKADDLLAVQLRVVWPWPSQTHHVRLATYVSRH